MITVYLNVLRKKKLKTPNKNDLVPLTSLVSFQRSLHAAEAEGEDCSVPANTDVLQQFDGVDSLTSALGCWRADGQDRMGKGGTGHTHTHKDPD